MIECTWSGLPPDSDVALLNTTVTVAGKTRDLPFPEMDLTPEKRGRWRTNLQGRGDRAGLPAKRGRSPVKGNRCRPRRKGSAYNSTGLMVSSKLPRFSDMYTLTIASADPKSISAKPTVEFTKSVTKWFTKDGVLVEGLFWKDVEGLINDYANKKSK
ncbi:hypothetical protein M8C21_002362 [Ambrosia artemisiifolia]|uniref:Signal peptidase complex subunit 2 n=1 Tax=Ambrosia artemisiifolia TaxID=4212 RepID=A0AAD5C3T2_AMBAR|nr:hypothetical protein M8C21_002362 [Ambrosia artemisiifolia]